MSEFKFAILTMLIFGVSVTFLYWYIKFNNQVKNMKYLEKHLVGKMHRNSIPEVISFEKWKTTHFNDLYFIYKLTEAEFTFPEFCRNLFDGNIILEFEHDTEKRIN